MNSPASNLINKRVKLHCNGNRIFDGFVYTVDPVSNNFIIYSKNETEHFHPIIVCAKGIEKLEVLNEELSPELLNHFNLLLSSKLLKTDDKKETLSHDQMQQRRQAVIDLFSQNRIDLKLDGDILSVFDSILIKPPYNMESCSGNNVIVLDRVKRIIQKVDN